MEGQIAEKTTEVSSEEQTIEALFQGLWDRVRSAGDLISDLRSQKSSLESRVESLEAEVQSLRDQLAGYDETARALKELRTAKASSDGRMLSNGDREVIAEKARKLLERIEEYL